MKKSTYSIHSKKSAFLKLLLIAGYGLGILFFPNIIYAATYEGFGAVTRGAEDAPNGYETYHVTKLDDDGTEGTLRDAVSQGSRLIVFDVGGTITLTRTLNVDESYMTIDGETAPEPGITIIQPHDFGTVIMPDGEDAHDIIIRYLRHIGPGGHPDTSADIWGLDGMDGHVYNIIIDHVTGIACEDGIFDIYGEVSDVTMSWNFMFDTLLAMHVSTADINQIRQRISFHHNVLARNNERQVKFRHHNEMVDFVNNVVYGWGWFEGGAYGLRIKHDEGEINTDINIERNVFHLVDTGHGGPDDAIIFETGSNVGKVYFNANIVPNGEQDTVSNSERLSIPIEAEVTAYDENTLGDSVVPLVGTHYPTQEEWDLLNEISLAIGGQGVDPDSPCIPNPCQNQSQCIREDTEFTCTCSQGYTGDLCESDIDECTLNIDNCNENATCTNTQGAFICACNTGYQGDGIQCTLISNTNDNTANTNVTNDNTANTNVTNGNDSNDNTPLGGLTNKGCGCSFQRSPLLTLLGFSGILVFLTLRRRLMKCKF